MARRNLMRSLCAASLLAVSVAAGVVGAPTLAGAEDAPAQDQPVKVTVHATHFAGPWDGSTVYARPGQTILFELADPADTHHTVTIERIDCNAHPRLCEQRFDNPNDRIVDFRWSEEREYRFYDRYAREAGREMTGKFVVTHSPPPIPPPATSTTVPSSTTTSTTGPTTTTSTAPTTTTTAPTTIRPFLTPDPAPTSTTTTARPSGPAPNGGMPAPTVDKGKDKDKGKSKAAATETATTAAPAPPEGPPSDLVFDPASLTPGPTILPDTPAGPDSDDEAAMDAAVVANLLTPEDGDDDGGRVVLYGLGALAFVFLVGAVWAWHHRSSRYFPA